MKNVNWFIQAGGLIIPAKHLKVQLTTWTGHSMNLLKADRSV